MGMITRNIEEIRDLENKAYELRRELVELASKHTIHIGGDLSVADILTVLWHKVLRYDVSNPKWELRDRFVLSKGHAAAAVYFCLERLGAYPRGTVMKEYYADGTGFGMAPCRKANPFFESSATGSLGMGLSIGAGIASALHIKGNDKSKVYVLLGDGELQEGCNWEAIMYAGHAKINNLIAIVDNNRLQFDGFTKDIVSVDDVSQRFEAFGWKCIEIDGHDIRQLVNVLGVVALEQEGPIVINAHTMKGKGVEYMEDNYLWHAGRVQKLEETFIMLAQRYEGERGNV